MITHKTLHKVIDQIQEKMESYLFLKGEGWWPRLCGAPKILPFVDDIKHVDSGNQHRSYFFVGLYNPNDETITLDIDLADDIEQLAFCLAHELYHHLHMGDNPFPTPDEKDEEERKADFVAEVMQDWVIDVIQSALDN